MAGDGLRRGPGTPRARTPAPGIQPGTSSALIVANLVVIFGPAGTIGGLFIYQQGTIPGLGNPPIFWATSGLKDPYGNTLPSTSGVAGTGEFTAGNTVMDSGGFSSTDANGTISINGSQVNFGLQAFMSINPTNVVTLGGTAGVATAQALIPFASFLIPVQPGTLNFETWHNLVPAAGFAAGGQPPRYRINIDDTVQLAGAVNLTAAQAAGTAFFGLPSGYVPAVSQFFATENSLAGYAAGNASVKVEAGGAVRINVAGANGNFVQLDGIRYVIT